MSLFFTKFIVKRIAACAILLNVCVIFNVKSAESLPQTDAADLTPQKIYAIAQDRNGKALGAIRNHLNIKYENCNTALCLEQQNKDKESFKMLLVFGASKDVECYDNTDTVCAIIIGEKLKVNGAGWLLGAAATAGAIYGASELLDNKKCPDGYSVQYQSVADCGKTGAEGWEYDWRHKDEKGKQCGRCTPKTYTTGCTTLWQSVNDCGEHPEGWLFESSGYSGDEICGICTPKQCINRDSTSVRGENIRYTDIEYCPHRDYMRPSSQEQKGWSGVHGCYICNYVCDEKNGFVQEGNCEKNAEGHAAYNCALDSDTQCHYRTTPKACPVTDTPTTRGSNVAFDTTANCPFRKYMVATGVTPGSWSGEGQCYTCNYACDEEYGFATETACKTNTSGGEGYICQLDPNTRCYYRSQTPTPDNPVNPNKPCSEGYDTAYQSQSNCAIIGGIPEGWIWKESGWSGELKCGKCEANSCGEGGSTAYKTVSDCPIIKNKIAVAVQAAGGYAGTEACNECIYWCDPAQAAFNTESACKTNVTDLNCQLDAETGCWVAQDGCPEGYSTRITSCSPSDGYDHTCSGYSPNNGKQCCTCQARACDLGSTTRTNCNDKAHPEGWHTETVDHYGNDDCKECIANECPGYEEKGGCSAGAYETATPTPTAHYAGNTQCYQCDYSCYNSYNTKTACDAAKSSTQYCKSVTNNITCWYPVEYACPSGYTAGLKVEDCDTYKNGHYYEQTTIEPDRDNSMGLDSSGNVANCYKCGFNCVGEHDGEPLVDSKDALGYVYFEVWGDPKCYLRKLPGNGSFGQCIDQNGHIETAYPESYIYEHKCPTIQSATDTTNDDSWLIVEKVGLYYGGEQCYLCAANPCSNQKAGTDTQCNQTGFTKGDVDSTITSGTTTCYTCNCDTENGYYDSESSVPDCADNIKSINNYNGKTCYYCPSPVAAMMSLRDNANNQTLIIHHAEGDYKGDTNINASATAPVTDELTGETTGGDAEGSITVYNSAANAEVTLQAGASRAVFNAKANGEDAENTVSAKGTLNLIMEEGAENVTAAAMSTDRNAYNAYAEGNAKASGVIDIKDTQAATNVIYGIMARRNAYNAAANGESAQAQGIININTATDKQAYGMFAGRDVYNQTAPNQTSIVNVSGSGAGDLYGLYSEQGSVYNSGNVNVHAARGNAYGIYVANGEGQIVDNSGNIIVASDTKTAYGIYVENAGAGMTLINSGVINATGDENSRGIKVAANGQNAVVTNTGRIIVNGAENAENTAIDLGGGKLANAGEIEFIGSQNLDDINGKATLEKGGKYKADSLSGSLKIGKSVVMEGFEDTYRQKDSIDAADIEGLEVTSESAMFKGSAEKNSHNGYDAVATRRSFNEFAPNDSIAAYLEENYKRQRLAEMFMQLKSDETDLSLSQDILSETGADFLINIPAENLAALRNAGEVIAESALSPTDDANRIMSGADSYIINAKGRRGATGYDTTAATAYMYGDKRLNNKNRLGLGLSFMQMSTSYDNSVDRKENFVSLFLPWIHKFSDKLRLASIFTAGYGYGEYDRGNGREADIQDIIYGITNKLVYEINLADIAELEPALVLNAIGYYQDEMDDGTLTVKSGNHMSVEAGVGLYLKKELMDSKYGRLTARLGGMYYHELADPYNKMRAGLNSGVGSYEINDFANIYSRDRAVLSAMLNYEYKKLALYLKYFHMLQRNKSQNFDMGIRYNF